MHNHTIISADADQESISIQVLAIAKVNVSILLFITSMISPQALYTNHLVGSNTIDSPNPILLTSCFIHPYNAISSANALTLWRSHILYINFSFHPSHARLCKQTAHHSTAQYKKRNEWLKNNPQSFIIHPFPIPIPQTKEKGAESVT